jgi:uncharacterized protein YprB with RNaseH-like and TPR domain
VEATAEAPVGSNLRARLRRIRELAPGKPPPEAAATAEAAVEASPSQAAAAPEAAATAVEATAQAAAEVSPVQAAPDQGPGPGWSPAGFKALKRSVFLDFSVSLPLFFPRTLGILVPDLFRYPRPQARPEDLVFFDLETTGLSGGAGTVAFLAAFGHFTAGEGGYRLRVDQYLLLDYPGEPDFLDALLREFAPPGGPPLIVTYHGKTFDAQILRTRCLMNGIAPPDFFHADLLHPARRLWKRLLPSCSQGQIETAVLGLDRTGDIPGALAPEIWFTFLKTGETGPLLGICDHYVKDIFGLARLLAALGRIAEDPLGALSLYPYDLENLALRWRKFRGPNGDSFFRGPNGDSFSGGPNGDSFSGGPNGDSRLNGPGGASREEFSPAGEGLLVEAARRGHPRAILTLARDLFLEGRFEPGRAWFRDLARGDHPHRLRAVAFRALAMDAERRLGDPAQALAYVEAALDLEIPEALRAALARRRERIMGNLSIFCKNP